MSAPTRPQLDINNLDHPREQRVVVLVRAAVVASWALLLVTDPRLVEPHPVTTWTLLAASAAWATVLTFSRLRELRSPPTWAISLVDSALTLVGCALTGGAHTLLVAVLPLIVIAAGLGGRRGYVVAVGLGAGYTVAVLVGDASTPVPDR
jgi:hypothetical protein